MSSDAPHTTADPADRVTSISCKCPLKLDNNRRCQNTKEFWWYLLKAGVTVYESWVSVISNSFLPSPQERTWSTSVYSSHSDLVSSLTKFNIHSLPMHSLSAYLLVRPLLLPCSSQSQFSMVEISFLFSLKALSRYFLQLLSAQFPSSPLQMSSCKHKCSSNTATGCLSSAHWVVLCSSFLV